MILAILTPSLQSEIVQVSGAGMPASIRAICSPKYGTAPHTGQRTAQPSSQTLLSGFFPPWQ